uniref:Uncharacterized protein n=1 Tax=Ascaris lumbricoides TaxID=6252 RepID=A0A0M3IVZ7_ASCLU
MLTMSSVIKSVFFHFISFAYIILFCLMPKMMFYLFQLFIEFSVLLRRV